jgi:hypothetical protein
MFNLNYFKVVNNLKIHKSGIDIWNYGEKGGPFLAFPKIEGLSLDKVFPSIVTRDPSPEPCCNAHCAGWFLSDFLPNIVGCQNFVVCPNRRTAFSPIAEGSAVDVYSSRSGSASTQSN